MLEAYVDGSLDAADREWVESHAEGCAVCLDDIGDLTRMREALRVVISGAPAPVATRPSGVRRGLAAAAAIVLVGGATYFWMVSRRPGTPMTTVATSAPVAPPATPALTDALSADERARVDRALASGTIEVPAAVAALASPRGTLLGAGTTAGEALAPTAPVGTAVLSPQPVFVWTSVTGATRYDVAVFDERFNEVASATGVTGTTWTPSKALPRGATLSWQVTAHVGGRAVLSPVPPQPEARFLVVDARVESAVAADRQRLAADPIALAVLLAERGLYADALSALDHSVAPAERTTRIRTAIQALKSRR